MQIFTPERGIKRGGERHPLISGTVARSRFSIADSTRQPTDDGRGRFLRVSACSLRRRVVDFTSLNAESWWAGVEGFEKGMISPANIDPFSRRGKRKRRENRDSALSRKICRSVLDSAPLSARFNFSGGRILGFENSSPAPKLIFTIRAVHNRARFIAIWRPGVLAIFAVSPARASVNLNYAVTTRPSEQFYLSLTRLFLLFFFNVRIWILGRSHGLCNFRSNLI